MKIETTPAQMMDVLAKANLTREFCHKLVAQLEKTENRNWSRVAAAHFEVRFLGSLHPDEVRHYSSASVLQELYNRRLQILVKRKTTAQEDATLRAFDLFQEIVSHRNAHTNPAKLS